MCGPQAVPSLLASWSQVWAAKNTANNITFWALELYAAHTGQGQFFQRALYGLAITSMRKRGKCFWKKKCWKALVCGTDWRHRSLEILASGAESPSLLWDRWCDTFSAMLYFTVLCHFLLIHQTPFGSWISVACNSSWAQKGHKANIYPLHPLGE